MDAQDYAAGRPGGGTAMKMHSMQRRMRSSRRRQSYRQCASFRPYHSSSAGGIILCAMPCIPDFYWTEPATGHQVTILLTQQLLVLRSAIIVLSERLHRINRQEVRKQVFYHPLNLLPFVKTGRAMIGADFPNYGGAYSARSVSKPNPSATRSSCSTCWPTCTKSSAVSTGFAKPTPPSGPTKPLPLFGIA